MIEAMQKRNVQVEIITARKRDQPVYKTFLNSYLFRKLHKHGAVVYEEPYKFLHMKAIEIDDCKQVNVGSFNHDLWSFFCNNEANLLLTRNAHALQQELGQAKAHLQFVTIYNNLLRECRPVDF